MTKNGLTNQEIDDQIHAIIVSSGRVIGNKEILQQSGIYFQRVTYSIHRLIAQEKIFEHGRVKIGVWWQLSYALWPRSSVYVGSIDKHILSEHWPVKVLVPAGKPRKVHRLLFDHEAST